MSSGSGDEAAPAVAATPRRRQRGQARKAPEISGRTAPAAKAQSDPQLHDFLVEACRGDQTDEEDISIHISVVIYILKEVYEVTTPGNAGIWLCATVQAFCECRFAQLSSVQLYAINALAKRVRGMSANHLLAMQDLLNYLYFANSGLFAKFWPCI